MHIKFKHGLGDAVAFSICLQHLQRCAYDFTFDCSYKELNAVGGWGSTREKLISFRVDKLPGGLPQTKPAWSLINELGIQIELNMFKYKPIWEIQTQKKDFILIHPTGVSLRHRKSLNKNECLNLCSSVSLISKPVILDYENEYINCGFDRVCPKNIKELFNIICSAKAMIGVDSGPEHLACMTNTPIHIIWRNTNPITNIDPHPNLHNWINSDCFKENINCMEYFWKNSICHAYENINTINKNLIGLINETHI